MTERERCTSLDVILRCAADISCCCDYRWKCRCCCVASCPLCWVETPLEMQMRLLTCLVCRNSRASGITLDTWLLLMENTCTTGQYLRHILDTSDLSLISEHCFFCLCLICGHLHHQYSHTWVSKEHLNLHLTVRTHTVVLMQHLWVPYLTMWLFSGSLSPRATHPPTPWCCGWTVAPAAALWTACWLNTGPSW